MRTNQGDFKQVNLRILDILLDTLNPRIEVAGTATQADIRTALLLTEEIFELAHGIRRTGGLLPGERIIVWKSGDQHIVLEGNRRVCACQLLLDRTLIPAGQKDKIPTISDELRERLETVQVDVSPTREAAEEVITKRHTELGVKKWSIPAKQRRIARYLAEGHTMEDAAKRFDEKAAGLKRTIQGFNLLKEARSLPCWTKEEKRDLLDPELKANPFIRFFQLKGVKDSFGIAFDEKDGTVRVPARDSDFENSLESLARKMLLKDRTGKVQYTTRTEPSEVLPAVLVGRLREAYEKSTKRHKAPAQKPSPRSKKPAATQVAFFENLVCQISEERVQKVVAEVASIDHHKLPIASAFLVRALIESTIDWCLDNAKQRGALMKEYKAKNPQGSYGPGLEFTLRYVIANHTTFFVDPDIKRALQHWFTNPKATVDMVIHGKMQSINGATLEALANQIRPPIQRILNKTAVK